MSCECSVHSPPQSIVALKPVSDFFERCVTLNAQPSDTSPRRKALERFYNPDDDVLKIIEVDHVRYTYADTLEFRKPLKLDAFKLQIRL